MSPTSYQLLYSRDMELKYRMVPVTGLEPVQYHYRGILSPLCLPFHHTGGYRQRLIYHIPGPVSTLFPKTSKIVESIIKCRRNRYGFSCIIFLSEGRRKEVKALNGYSYLTLEQRREIEKNVCRG